MGPGPTPNSPPALQVCPVVHIPDSAWLQCRAESNLPQEHLFGEQGSYINLWLLPPITADFPADSRPLEVGGGRSCQRWGSGHWANPGLASRSTRGPGRPCPQD